MRSIFISYSHGGHKPFIDALGLYLESSGFILIDGREKRAQSTESAFSAIRRASAFVALVSSNSPNEMLELGIAVGLGKPILIIAQSNEDLPSNLRGFLIVRGGESTRDLALEVVRRIDQLNIPKVVEGAIEEGAQTLLEILKSKPDSLYSIDPLRFEELVAEVFRDIGYEVKLSGGSGDRGIDFVLIEPDSQRTAVVQVKRRSPHSKVSVNEIRELIGATILNGANKGIFVTTSAFTKSAYDLVEKSPVELELIDIEKLLSKGSGKIKPGI